MTGIVDYGAGNLRSLQNALDRIGARWRLISGPNDPGSAERIILPGVGAAASAMRLLEERDLLRSLRESSRPVLGICLGAQLLFERSTEGDARCLGIIGGAVERFTAGDVKVPHVGWNSVTHDGDDPMFDGIGSGEHFYFVHAYHFPATPAAIATTHHGYPFASAIAVRNYRGVQFHPEKSGEAGLRLLRNFIELC